MILSGQSIRKRGIISPFNERSVAFGMSYGVSSCGYDIRIAERIALSAGECRLASSIEHFDMPNDIAANVTDKSTLARQFIAVQNTIIEPGWRGFLVLEISNHGKTSVTIEAGSPISQIIFHLLDEATERPYSGKYQDQGPGVVPARFE